MNRTSIRALAILAASILTASLAVLPAAAQTEAVLANFVTNSTTIGYDPVSLIIDSAGNLYGANSQGGPYGSGTVFMLSPKSGGGWQPTILHAFNPANGDGSGPAGLVLDASGHIFGVTGGGAHGDGTIFEIIQQTDGHWREKVLYNFTDPSPTGLTLDAAGNLYGAVTSGPQGAPGYIYELTPSTSGHWSKTTLYVFQTNGPNDGYQPSSAVTFDGAGNLYGTTFYGGANCSSCGTVYELSPMPGGTWTESVLHSFDGTDGRNPIAGVTFDSAGNLYGAVWAGGPGLGAAYELTPGTGGWTYTTLYDFLNNGGGILPFTTPVLNAGNLYGTTEEGGIQENGVVYELTSNADGSWSYATYFAFDGADGGPTASGVAFDTHGHLYGTTSTGGAGGGGVIYGIKP
jgi:uncharacterized repeat protein (TIGR03803 family)